MSRGAKKEKKRREWAKSILAARVLQGASDLAITVVSFFRLANQPFKDAKQGCWSPEKIAGPPFPFHFGVAARRGARYVGRQKNGTKVGAVDVNTLPTRQTVLNLYLFYFYLFSSFSLKRWMAIVVRGLFFTKFLLDRFFKHESFIHASREIFSLSVFC